MRERRYWNERAIWHSDQMAKARAATAQAAANAGRRRG